MMPQKQQKQQPRRFLSYAKNTMFHWSKRTWGAKGGTRASKNASQTAKKWSQGLPQNALLSFFFLLDRPVFGDALRFLSTDTPWHNKNATPELQNQHFKPKTKKRETKFWVHDPKKSIPSSKTEAQGTKREPQRAKSEPQRTQLQSSRRASRPTVTHRTPK